MCVTLIVNTCHAWASQIWVSNTKRIYRIYFTAISTSTSRRHTNTTSSRMERDELMGSSAALVVGLHGWREWDGELSVTLHRARCVCLASASTGTCQNSWWALSPRRSSAAAAAGRTTHTAGPRTKPNISIDLHHHSSELSHCRRISRGLVPYNGPRWVKYFGTATSTDVAGVNSHSRTRLLCLQTETGANR